MVWSPGIKKPIRKLEGKQRETTKLPPGLKELPHKERLTKLDLITLEQRRERERGDLITLYRVMTGMEKLDREELVTWDIRVLRGHGRKLKKNACRRDVLREKLV